MSKGPEIKELRSDPVEGVVQLLEEYLEDAKRGDIRSIAFVCVRKGDVVGVSWSRGDGGTHFHQLVAGSVHLQHRLMSGVFDD